MKEFVCLAIVAMIAAAALAQPGHEIPTGVQYHTLSSTEVTEPAGTMPFPVHVFTTRQLEIPPAAPLVYPHPTVAPQTFSVPTCQPCGSPQRSSTPTCSTCPAPPLQTSTYTVAENCVGPACGPEDSDGILPHHDGGGFGDGPDSGPEPLSGGLLARLRESRDARRRGGGGLFGGRGLFGR